MDREIVLRPISAEASVSSGPGHVIHERQAYRPGAPPDPGVRTAIRTRQAHSDRIRPAPSLLASAPYAVAAHPARNLIPAYSDRISTSNIFIQVRVHVIQSTIPIADS